MMTSLITPVNLSDIKFVADAVADLFPSHMWRYFRDSIVVSFDEDNLNALYNVASKLDFIQFSLGMEGHEISFENGPAVLLEMCEAFEMEEMVI